MAESDHVRFSRQLITARCKILVEYGLTVDAVGYRLSAPHRKTVRFDIVQIS